MLSYRFEDVAGENGRFVITFDEWSDRDRIFVGPPNDKRDNALGVRLCSVANQTPCNCGAVTVGIVPFQDGHLDSCAVYRSPLLDWP